MNALIGIGYWHSKDEPRLCAAPEPIRRQWAHGTVTLGEGRDGKGFSHLRSTAQTLGLEIVFRKDENGNRAVSDR